ncbi:PepSY domain-containing protein (plasmid) [Sinorhizobium mexicanum]|uniref:PepSY domain-containing protein n=2 Tax=Sinorhizobium mexicanum TaxID=375549 RepID=A0A859R125_9HYPH|nr:PepSY domain-containing protein [Sinorhizobium mexicanum]
MRTTLFCALAVAALPALALADDDSASCTTKPQSAWMKPEVAASKVEEAGYSDVRNIKVAGSCYEIYAFTAEHRRAEVYMNPVTAEIVKAEVGD